MPNVVRAKAADNDSVPEPPEHERLALEDIRKRGLSLEVVEYAGIYPVEDARALVNAHEARPGIIIPFFDVNGEPIFYEIDGRARQVLRVRLLGESHVGGFTEKKPARYLQPTGIPPHLYIPRVKGIDWPAVFSNPEIPVIITEGELKALYACTRGYRAIAIGGVYNFTTHDGAFLPQLERIASRGRHVFIAFDSDAATNPGVGVAERRLCAELVKRGSIPHIVRLPAQGSEKVGLDDFLKANGPEAFDKLCMQTPPADPGLSLVVVGTDPEIADSVLMDLAGKHLSEVVYYDGDFHIYEGTHWRALPDEEIRNAVCRYDKLKAKSVVKLTKARVDSIVSFMRDKAINRDFFAETPAGINCASGFITFDGKGNPSLEPHDREHRQRHCLPGSWKPGASWRDAKLLGTLLHGCLGTDADFEDKVKLMQEICGVVALGIATKLSEPKAVVLYGPSAGNGKSEMLAMLRGLLPANAICTVSPTRFGDDKMVVSLAGKLLNACDELGTAQAVAGDTFKAVITGNSVRGRGLYKNPVDFTPIATHVYATNQLPSFHGGMDPGVQRRVLVLPFNRSIPNNERIPEISRRIAVEESDALLAFAVEGAGHVLRNRKFTEPASCRSATRDWIFSADPVLAFLGDEATYAEGHREKTGDVYFNFKTWAEREGIRPDRLPASSTFFNRLHNQDGRLGKVKVNGVRYIVGLKLKRKGVV